MITKKDILKMVGQVRKRSQGKQSHQLINPKREWVRGLVLLTIILVLGALVSGWLYIGYTNLDAAIEASPSNVARYDENGIARALEQYDKRQQRYDELRTQVLFVQTPTATSTASSTEAGEEVVSPTTPVAEESMVVEIVEEAPEEVLLEENGEEATGSTAPILQ